MCTSDGITKAFSAAPTPAEPDSRSRATNHTGAIEMKGQKVRP